MVVVVLLLAWDLRCDDECVRRLLHTHTHTVSNMRDPASNYAYADDAPTSVCVPPSHLVCILADVLAHCHTTYERTNERTAHNIAKPANARSDIIMKYFGVYVCACSVCVSLWVQKRVLVWFSKSGCEAHQHVVHTTSTHIPLIRTTISTHNNQTTRISLSSPPNRVVVLSKRPTQNPRTTNNNHTYTHTHRVRTVRSSSKRTIYTLCVSRDILLAIAYKQHICAIYETHL